MKPLPRNILYLTLLEVLIIAAGLVLTAGIIKRIPFSDVLIVSGVFFILTIIPLTIFFRGQSKGPEKQTMHSLVSVSSKFLFELIFAFIWFFMAKKTGWPSVLLFFVLYLSFSLFSVVVILKTLKNKPL